MCGEGGEREGQKATDGACMCRCVEREGQRATESACVCVERVRERERQRATDVGKEMVIALVSATDILWRSGIYV